MTPTFIGIGAMRTGTTWTWRCLNSHPEISFPGGKQVHFWDKHLDRGTDWYRSTLAASEPITGDITPAYAILDGSTVKRIHLEFPHTRVFFVVRDPVDRAWSSAQLHLRRNDIDPATVSDEWLRQRFATAGIRKRNAYRSTVHRWLDLFGPEQFRVLSFDQLTTEPSRFLATIARHVGADPEPFLAPDQAMRTQISTPRNTTQPTMPADLRRFGEDLYREELDWFRSYSFEPLI